MQSFIVMGGRRAVVRMATASILLRRGCCRLKTVFSWLWNSIRGSNCKPILAPVSPSAARRGAPLRRRLAGNCWRAASARRSTSTPPTRLPSALRLFQQALAGRDHLVCYAVKANSALAILKLLAQHGAGFDIVSGGELERVLAAAPEAVGRVVFSGVGKTAAEIDLALKAGILQFNVESEAELELLAARARKLKVRARFALRVNPDVFADTHPYISTGLREHKFGIDIRRAPAIYKSAAGNRWLEAHGVSVHIGSQIRSADPFGAAIERVSKLVQPTPARRHRASELSMPAAAWASIITAAHSMPRPKCRNMPRRSKRALGGFDGRLLIEPGRFLVAQAGALVARVLYVKRNGKKTFVITDAAMNDLIRPALYQAITRLFRCGRRAGKPRIVDVVGPVCESGDFFARDRKLAPVEPGDWWLCSMPAPTAWRKAPTTTPARAPPRCWSKAAKARLIRRRETMADLLAPEVL